jgi:uncharacterized iron-regulated membrane protein
LSFRNLVLTLHLWAGLLAGASLLVLGMTGSLLVYERGIDRLQHLRLVNQHVEPALRRFPFKTKTRLSAPLRLTTHSSQTLFCISAKLNRLKS